MSLDKWANMTLEDVESAMAGFVQVGFDRDRDPKLIRAAIEEVAPAVLEDIQALDAAGFTSAAAEAFATRALYHLDCMVKKIDGPDATHGITPNLASEVGQALVKLSAVAAGAANAFLAFVRVAPPTPAAPTTP